MFESSLAIVLVAAGAVAVLASVVGWVAVRRRSSGGAEPAPAPAPAATPATDVSEASAAADNRAEISDAEAIEPELPAAVDVPADSPAVADPSEAPVVAEPVEAPVLVEPVADPAVAEPSPEPEPVAGEPTPEPVAVAEPAPEPVVDEPAPAVVSTGDDGSAVDAESDDDTAPADDFRKIEGIGPKLATALQAAGFRTYRQLAETDEATLRAALRTAGVRATSSLPSWPERARKLADG